MLLAAVAAIPVVQLASLGYLLEAEGRVARSGRLRDALPELELCARIGGAVMGLLLVFAPFFLLRDFWSDAWVIDPSSRATRVLGVLTIAAFSLALVHSALALASGARLAFFFRPFSNLRWALAERGKALSLASLRGRALAVLDEIDPIHHFLLGAKGFVAAVVWLAIPSLLVIAGISSSKRGEGLPAVSLLGGFLLIFAVIPLPLLQARLAVEKRIRAGFELRAVWRRFRRAPIVSLIALIATLGLALPLYAFKIELIPRDALWLAGVVFVALALPGKLLAGKAYARGSREGRAFFPLRFACAALALPAAGFYSFYVSFESFANWFGAATLLTQHAFLVPTAFY